MRGLGDGQDVQAAEENNDNNDYDDSEEDSRELSTNLFQSLTVNREGPY